VLEDDKGMPIRDEKLKMLQLMNFLRPLFMFIKRAVLAGSTVRILFYSSSFFLSFFSCL
jgi:hypothetical protein